MKTIQIVDKSKYYLNTSKTAQFFSGDWDGKVFSTGLQAYCRETFGGNVYFNKDTKMVGYYNGSSAACAIGLGRPVSGLNLEVSVDFWREVEKRLGLKNCEIYQGSLPNTLVMEVDPFWSINYTRRGFYTMFLRCACSYAVGKRFEEDLERYAYTSKDGAGAAIHHFLAGHTTPAFDEKSMGVNVYSKFCGTSATFLRENLVKMIEV